MFPRKPGAPLKTGDDGGPRRGGTMTWQSRSPRFSQNDDFPERPGSVSHGGVGYRESDEQWDERGEPGV